MAPKRDPMDLLFHPRKKPIKKELSGSSTASSGSNSGSQPQIPKPSPSRPKRPPPSLKSKQDDEEFKLPDGPYIDYRLMSSALNGWKYDVMKFDSRKPIDISHWQAPIKLNRKDLRREVSGGTPGVAVKPMLGPDGNAVYAPDGRPVMVDAEGRIVPPEGSAEAEGKGKSPAKKKFQKKTRQVFIVPEEVRQLRKEERYPWVIEDASGSEVWVAQLEDLSKSETHAFFMPAANNDFKFVPAHRWYKFQKKIKHDLPTDTQAVESAFSLTQKRDPQAWLAQRTGRDVSDATAAIFKAEAEGKAVEAENSLVYSSGQSLGPGGRRLKTVDSGMNGLFGDDEDDPISKRSRKREFGEDGDLDENVYEEEFADDDDRMEMEDNQDDEAKELEERLKKEYKSANKQREGYIDESDSDDDTRSKSKQEKAMQKLIRNREGNDAYESDEEENPYASSEDEQSDDEIISPVPPPPPVPSPDAVQSSADSTLTSKTSTPKPLQNGMGSPRAGSPTASVPSPGHGGGHSIVAKRATSPKAPKAKNASANGAKSPLGSRAGSPVANGSRATSPVGGTGSRASSPAAGSPVPNGAQLKRKAADDANGGVASISGNVAGAQPKAKKRKANGPAPARELDDQMVIEWLKNTPNAKTRDCISYFQPYLTDEAKKQKFTTLVKEIATLKSGVLTLRPAYRGGEVVPTSLA